MMSRISGNRTAKPNEIEPRLTAGVFHRVSREWLGVRAFHVPIIGFHILYTRVG